MPADWYCEVQGQRYGPITSGQLKQLATEGKLKPTHPVWREGMKQKVPASSVKGLFDSAPAATPPPAPADDAAAETGRLLASVLEPTEEDEMAELETIEAEVEEELEEFETIETEEEELVDLEPVEDSPPPPPKKQPPPPKKTLPQKNEVPLPAAEEHVEPAPPTSGKPFRVMMGGEVRGPYSLEELQGLLKEGKLGGNALIGVETWLPVATLSGMLTTAPAPKSDSEEVEDLHEEQYGDFEEVHEEEPKEEKKEVKKEPPPAPPPPAKVNEGDSLPVDEEFKIG
jgi:hypothetical protein